MEIKVSDSIGFCFGVKQAIDLTKKALSKKKDKIFSVGPLIHNPQVVGELLKKGLSPIDNIGSIKEGTIIVSSHGAGAKLLAKGESTPRGKDRKSKSNLKIIDATCPFVKKIQDCVKRLYKDGYKVIIIGKKEHPEVKALADFTEGKAVVIKDVSQAKKIKPGGSKIGVVSQSTYSQQAFLEIVAILLQKQFLELRIFNTICKDTIKRQNTVRELAHRVDAMIVIGGRDSANTRRLVEVCKREGKVTYHIEDNTQIDPSWFKNKKTLGIASGASTPDWVVQEVIKKIKASDPRGCRPKGRYS